MMSSILVYIAPFVVSAITGLLKKLPVFENLSWDTRPPAIRTLAAFIAVVYVVVGIWIHPGAVSVGDLSTVVQAFGIALVSWLGSLGVFHAFFQKKV